MEFLSNLSDIIGSFLCGIIFGILIISTSPKVSTKDLKETSTVTDSVSEGKELQCTSSPSDCSEMPVDSDVSDTVSNSNSSEAIKRHHARVAENGNLSDQNGSKNFKEILEKTTLESLPPEESEVLVWLSSILFFAACCAALYFINVATKGEFGRFIAGMFPVETAALKIKDYLEKV